MIDDEQGQATRRIIRLFSDATDEELAYGLTWYAEANTYASELGELHGYSTDAVAGVIAALSPQTEWGLNKRKAEQFLAEGDTTGFTLGRGRARAIVEEGLSPLDVLGGPKVRAFYSNIADPASSTAVAIDRHALDAVLGFVGTDKTRKVLDRKGAYEEVADVYRSAARNLGVAPHVVQGVVWAVWRNRYGQFAYQRPGQESNVYGPRRVA